MLEEVIRAAYKLLAPASTDAIVCDPELRARFLQTVRSVVGLEVPEKDLLQRLLIMRKNRMLR